MSANLDKALVDKIAAQVIKALAAKAEDVPTPGSLTPGSSTPGSPAPIAPPIGVCTGDYSKFEELKNKPLSNPAPKTGDAPIPGSAPSPTPQPPPLTGIVTANQLQAAMDAASDHVAMLAHDARLSPLANDLARQFPDRVRRAEAPAAKSASAAPTAWMWWIDGSCPVVDQAVSAKSDRLVSAAASHRSSALVQVVRDLAAAIKARRVAGGILFVHSAAKAMCYANRCASLRAVVGTCGEAVEQGVTEIGANVLVIEYPHHGQRSVNAMLDRILQQPPKVPANIERELSDLHRCP